MSDTTETVSLRDALRDLLADRKHDPMMTYQEDADAVLDLLRAHRTETLVALGGELKQPQTFPTNDGLGWPLIVVADSDAAVWVFREASE